MILRSTSLPGSVATTVVARVLSQVGSWHMMGEMVLGPDFSQVLRFPLSILIPPTLSH
jgi:hypothetical protein